MAREFGFDANTSVAANPMPQELQSRLRVYPQIFIVDRGEVVRTCARIEECR